MLPPSVSRRNLLAGLLAGGAAGLGVEVGVGDSPSLDSWTPDAGSWPATRRGPRRSAAAPDADPPGPEPAAEWRAEIAGGARFVVAGETVYAGRQSGVTAFELGTGDRRWERDRRATDLCVRDGRLYCGGGRVGDVAALDVADGSVQWRLDAETGRRTYDLLHVDDTLLVGRHGSLEGVDPVTGASRWESNVGGLGEVCPAVAGGTLYAGGPGPLELYRPREGWSAVLEAGPEQIATAAGPVFGMYPAVGPDGVYVGGYGLNADTALFGFDRDGGRRWEGPSATSLTAPVLTEGDPAVGVTRLFHGERDQHRVVGVDLTDGTVRWRREWVDELTAPVLAGDRIVVAQQRGDLRAIDPDTGETAWETTVDASPVSLVPAGERLLVSGAEGTVLSLR